MKTINLHTFEEFEQWVAELKNKQAAESLGSGRKYSELLFRGHADENWGLQTTLERFAPNITSLNKYMYTAEKIRYQVELHAETTWDPILKDGEIRQSEKNSIGMYADIPSPEYLVYLRHHGFPSPLLDWTRSPYIASLFAFSTCGGTGSIAIFVYQEYLGRSKLYSSDSTFIQNMGPHIKTHKRHTLQQAQYTICLKASGARTALPYDIKSHESHSGGERQDTVYKITIPKSEKLKVLIKLEQFNLNLYSILGSEEALMTTLATREFLLVHGAR